MTFDTCLHVPPPELRQSVVEYVCVTVPLPLARVQFSNIPTFLLLPYSALLNPPLRLPCPVLEADLRSSYPPQGAGHAPTLTRR